MRFLINKTNTTSRCELVVKLTQLAVVNLCTTVPEVIFKQYLSIFQIGKGNRYRIALNKHVSTSAEAT